MHARIIHQPPEEVRQATGWTDSAISLTARPCGGAEGQRASARAARDGVRPLCFHAFDHVPRTRTVREITHPPSPEALRVFFPSMEASKVLIKVITRDPFRVQISRQDRRQWCTLDAFDICARSLDCTNRTCLFCIISPSAVILVGRARIHGLPAAHHCMHERLERLPDSRLPNAIVLGASSASMTTSDLDASMLWLASHAYSSDIIPPLTAGRSLMR